MRHDDSTEEGLLVTDGTTATRKYKDRGEATRIRLEFLDQEVAVHDIGTLFLVMSFFLVFPVIFVVAVTLATEQPSAQQLLIACVVVGGTILGAKIGCDLRRFRPWARGITIIFSIPSLAGFPIGTILSAYILFVLLHPKSSVVFSARYRTVIRQTPEIRPRQSIATWLLVILGPILLFAAFYAAFWM